MRKKYYLMALAGLLMASCSEDNDPFGPNRGQGQAGQRELSFVFPGTAHGVVPYAVTALDAENELSTLDIYVFGVDSMSGASPQPMVLEEIFRSGQGYTLTTSGSDKTAKISVPAGNNKAFFFVANAREHLSLDSVALHVTDTATFKTKMSNTLKGHITCPMLMSAQLDMPDVAKTVADATTAGTGVKVELTRRVARFDIKNNSETSNFVISKVSMADVPGNVPLFPMDAYVAPLVADMPLIDFSAMKNSNAGVTNSVFYMYPIKMTTGDEVKFSLVGTNLITNAAQVLDVEFKEYRSGDVVDIEANNRYLVEVEDLGSGELDATLRVIEWIVGDTVNVNTGDGSIKLSCEAAGFADNTLVVAAEPTLTDSVAIAVAADGEWELIVEDQYKDWLGVSALPGDTVLKEFKVTTLLPNPSSKEERQGVVMVQNVRRPSIRQPLIVKQAAQDPTTGRYLDLSGKAIAGNLLAFSGEKTTGDSLNITVTAPAGTSWKATKTATATWFTFGNEATGLKSAAADGSAFDGTAEETFSIVPTPNTDKDNARVDTVIITIAGADDATDLVQKLIVRQAPQNLGSITVKCIGLSDGKVSIPAAGFADKADKDGNHAGERKVTVNATTEWKVVIPAEATWLTQEGAITLVPDSKNGSFYLKAVANTAVDAVERTAIVRIENTQDATIYQEITFTQAADPVAAPVTKPTLGASALTVDNDGTNLSASTITISGIDAADLGDWSINGSYNWVSAVLTNETTITVTMANDGNEDNSGVGATERAATFTLKHATDNDASVTFTVTQAGETLPVAPVLASNALTVDNTGASLSASTIAINSGITDASEWEIENDSANTWVSAVLTDANTITVTMSSDGTEDNSAGAERVATIKLKNKAHPTVSVTFTVTQPGA